MSEMKYHSCQIQFSLYPCKIVLVKRTLNTHDIVILNGAWLAF